ncbi:MAG: MATE family efflux transporter [Muribaculaceae bacterium]|nr:MATE family efflux transporter [Muribaculaceae bacterium]
MKPKKTETKDGLLAMIRNGQQMTLRQQLLLTAQLSIPAILAELSSIVMQYIDASMVGSLGADDSASIGLVSTTLWLFGGMYNAVATGFAVQVAHLIGAKQSAEARSVLRQSLVAALLFSLSLAIVGVAISGYLPIWLGGNERIVANASRYFLIFMLGMPLLMLDFLATGMLRCSGNMKVPSALNVLMCVLDVVFNFFFIFPSHHLHLLGQDWVLPGMGMGVVGAAIGTILAESVVCCLMLWYLVTRSNELRLNQERGSFRPRAACVKRAWSIGFPMGIQHVVMCSAQIAITAIVAPLGSVAIAANSFAITAESLCYMPGYGISDAATTLVGQSMGAGRRYLMRRFAYITVTLGMVVMSVMGVLLYVAAPLMMGIMSPVAEVVELGAQCLRIEAFAEPLFAAAIVCYGVFVGAGDTLTPCWMNVGSMWAVRLTLAAVLVGSLGLAGVWVAMCVELCFRGTIFLIRLFSGRWMRRQKMVANA